MSYHGMKTLSHQGIPTGMVYGVLRTYVDFKKRYPHADIKFLWEGMNSWRKRDYPIYKAKRKKYAPDPNFGRSLDNTRELINYLQCDQCTLDEYEADDLAKYYADLYQDDLVLLVSKDHDWQVLLNDTTDVWYDNRVHTFIDINKKLGFDNSRLTLNMILTGDASDSISGVPLFRKAIALEMCNSPEVKSEEDIIPWLEIHYPVWAEKTKKNWWIVERNLDLIYLDVDSLPIEKLVVKTTEQNDAKILEFIKLYGIQSLTYFFSKLSASNLV